MSITSLDHLYAETADWEASVSFWVGLGFAFAERWGSEGHRAGRLVSGTATVVLAEVAESPAFTVFFGLRDDQIDLPDGLTVTTPLHDTHWGTKLVRVEDPDGRVIALEYAP